MGTLRRSQPIHIASSLAVLTTAVSIAVLMAQHMADADTSGNPSTITASTSIQPDVARPGPLTNLSDASTAHVVVTSTPGTNNGFDIRECKGGVNITSNASFVPLQGKNCIDPITYAPDANHSYYQTVLPDVSLTTATTDFKVATGTFNWSTPSGPASITCDSANPCSLWIKNSFGATVYFSHYDLTFAGPASSTTSSSSTTTTSAGSTSSTSSTSTTLDSSSTTSSSSMSSSTSTTAAPTLPTVTMTSTTVAMGQDITFTSCCWSPNATVKGTVNSTPIDLPTMTSDATGKLGKSVAVPSGLELGEHTLTLTGPVPGYTGDKTATLSFTVVDQSATSTTVSGSSTGAGTTIGSGSLPVTGATLDVALFALLLTLLGVALTIDHHRHNRATGRPTST